MADAAQLPALTQVLRAFWSAADLQEAQAATFELALEEVFMNIVMHGSAGNLTPRVTLCVALAGGELTLTIEDDGPSFDPLGLAEPDLTASVEDRKVGGLGVFLVRQMMDRVCYRRLEGRNQLLMTKDLNGKK